MVGAPLAGGRESLRKRTVPSKSACDQNRGDIVFVRKRETADLGQIVVARVGASGETTVKRLGRLKGQPALLPENRAHRPIRIDAETEIVGVVVGLLRGYEGRATRAR